MMTLKSGLRDIKTYIQIIIMVFIHKYGSKIILKENQNI